MGYSPRGGGDSLLAIWYASGWIDPPNRYKEFSDSVPLKNINTVPPPPAPIPMPSQLQQELKQRKPFTSLRQEVLLSVARTSAVLTHSFEQALKAHGITLTQYNVLRILRGAGSEGLCRYEIGDRLITPVPDVSRLLDRMGAAGLLTRERALTDRRLVVACITPKGLAALGALDAPSREIIDSKMKHMTDDQLTALRDLLDLARQGSVPADAYPPAK